MSTSEVGTTPGMYCRRCWYVLDHLTEHRCPECGRPFDLTQPKSYRRRPRGRWWLTRLCWTAAAVLLLLSAGAGWYYWRYTVGQRGMAHLRAAQQMQIPLLFQTEPVLPRFLVDALSARNIPIAQSVVSVSLYQSPEQDLGVLLRGLDDLKSLTFWGRSFTDEQAAQLTHLSALRHLRLDVSRRLDIDQMTDKGLAHIATLSRLEELDLHSTHVTDVGLAHLASLSRLEQLDLQGTRVTGAGLAHLECLPNLKTLSLSVRQVTATGAASLGRLTSLRHLSVYGRRTTDEVVQRIASLANLRSLYFYGATLGDAQLRHLTAMHDLERLNLAWTNVTDAGLPYLKGLPKLHELNLTGTSVSPEAIGALERALPRLTVTPSGSSR